MKKDSVSNLGLGLQEEVNQLLQLKMWGVMVFGKEFILELDLNKNRSIYKTTLKRVNKNHLQALLNSIRALLGDGWHVSVKSGKDFLIKDGKVINNVRNSRNNNAAKPKRAKSLRKRR